MQVPCRSLMRLRGPLSPGPPAGLGWNPNAPLAPLPTAAWPGTVIPFVPPPEDSESSATIEH